MTYLLDANVFIEAKNRHYGFDVVPGFWEWLDDAHDRSVVSSMESVRAELLAGGDELSDRAKDRAEFFLAPDDSVVASFREVAEWANTNGYDDGAVSTFLQDADAYLVAHGHAYGLTVVTHEVASPSVRKIKIPDAGEGMGVAHCPPFDMLGGKARGSFSAARSQLLAVTTAASRNTASPTPRPSGAHRSAA